jgi:hypothetical protein
MNDPFRCFLSIFCITGALFAFVFNLDVNKYNLDREGIHGLFAGIHVNIEIDKKYAQHPIVVTAPGDKFFWPSPTYYEPHYKNTVLYAAVPIAGLYRSVFLALPADMADAVKPAIDNIAVFIGNRSFYFSNREIDSFETRHLGAYTLYAIPGLKYANSFFIRNWTNYFGDFNIIIKSLCSFLLYPGKFALSWIFLIIFFLLNRSMVTKLYSRVKTSGNRTYILLAMILLFGFLLRINGFVRYSASPDELYCTTKGSNPNLPFLNTFGDPGNPPLYFIFLRFWYMLFGWSEESGRLLSVVLGTGAILTLFIFVRKFSSSRIALLAAFLMAINNYAIGHSKEMRTYILVIFLTPLVSLFLLSLIKKQNAINVLLYAFFCILISNTHYFGVLFVVANFLFYFIYKLYTGSVTLKNSVAFVCVNIAAGLSFLPFFLYTALQNAVLNASFNNNIERPGIDFIVVAIGIVVLFVILFIYHDKTKAFIMQNNFFAHTIMLLSYAFIAVILVFLLSFTVSFLRPILIWRYLAVCFPLLLVVMSILMLFPVKKPVLQYLAPVVFLSIFIASYESRPGRQPANTDKEALAYISADVDAHPDVRATVLDDSDWSFWLAKYYGHNILQYGNAGDFDVIYLPRHPLRTTEDLMYEDLHRFGFDNSNMLKIRINEDRVIFKKIIKSGTS